MRRQLADKYIVTPWRESSGHCDCCGKTSRSIWGDVARGADTVAVYFIHWTVGAPEHFPNIDMIIGPWGRKELIAQRFLVCLLVRPPSQGGDCTVIDAAPRFAGKKHLCGHALAREDVIDTPLAKVVFDLFDAIFLDDPRLMEGAVFEE